MKTIKESVSVEIVVKKSKFIANVFEVDSKEDAEEKIKSICKKYYDAKHNCYAYVVENYEKCSDDGEPSKTAGAPILEIIKKNNLENVLVVVTRYFGGILLGTGGLVRAYQEASKLALEKAGCKVKQKGIEYKIKIDYEEQKNTIYWIKKLNINILKSKYEDLVELTLQSSEENKEKLLNNIKIAENCVLLKENIYIEEEN